DATFGGGGHSREILKQSSPNGRVIALDRDPSVERFANQLNEEFPGRLEWHCLSFDEVSSLGQCFDGAVLDLGMSSDQLEVSGRGFSFSRNEPLDLRFDDRHGQTASQLLMQSSPLEIERVFREYGQDRYAKKLAVRIVNERRTRPIRSTEDFVNYVGTDNPKVLAPLFQALRIAVNDELNTLKGGLSSVAECLKPGAAMVVISFHSLEDRVVKQFFQGSPFNILTKKPTMASANEQQSNPRSRSAKLRAGRKQ
ncbi:MAG: 16S rRNA (cytosine(1402)-N(4))-methyltransferase RsmH, partial [Patescibacteria group bacterium]